MPSVTFLSYNSTGLGEVKCDWLNSLAETVNANYISIQEHFRKSKTIEKYFADEFPRFNSYVIPGYREKGQDRGRPKAGLAQLSYKCLEVKKDRVMTNSYQLQAQILCFETSRLLWINSYLPTDPNTVNFDERELLEVLTEIEHILDTAQYDDVLWTGDLNWQMSRQSGFSMTVRRFIDRLGLRSLWEDYEIDFTHVHTDNKSFSTIDHFIMNERLMSLVTDCGPIHLGDNLSRHSQIMVRLNMGELTKKQRSNFVKPCRPSWYKATEEQREAYTEDLLYRLEAVTPPESLSCQDPDCKDEHHSEERDGFVLDCLSAVIESSHATIPMVGGRLNSARSDNGCMPGWKDEVSEFRNNAKFWHSLWISCGKPTTGNVFEIMKRTKNQYHYSIRRV